MQKRKNNKEIPNFPDRIGYLIHSEEKEIVPSKTAKIYDVKSQSESKTFKYWRRFILPGALIIIGTNIVAGIIMGTSIILTISLIIAGISIYLGMSSIIF